MVNQLITALFYVVMFLLYTIILWKISKRQKLKKHDLKTAFLVIGIPTVISFIIYLTYSLINPPILVKVIMSIFILFLTPYLIKKFYIINWWSAIKIYLLTILVSFLLGVGVFIIITILYPVLYTLLKPHL